MSTRTTEANRPPEGFGASPAHSKVAKRVWVSVLVVAIVGLVTGALVMLGWMVDETHFDRPSGAFDEFEAQVEGLPGVTDVETERWVEAPTFSNPTSWMSVTVDDSGFRGLLDTACSTDYPDPISWSIRVQSAAASEVSLHSTPTAPNESGEGARCPDFGFDTVPLIGELDRVAPGLSIQPVIWENGRFALVALEDEPPTGFTHLLPLVARADDLLVASGLDADALVEINSSNLGLVFEPGESDGYVALLTELSQNHGVRSFWADGGGTPDGIETVQLVAPDQHQAAIEDLIQSSGLYPADLTVRFLEQSPPG